MLTDLDLDTINVIEDSWTRWKDTFLSIMAYPKSTYQTEEMYHG